MSVKECVDSDGGLADVYYYDHVGVPTWVYVG